MIFSIFKKKKNHQSFKLKRDYLRFLIFSSPGFLNVVNEVKLVWSIKILYRIVLNVKLKLY